MIIEFSRAFAAFGADDWDPYHRALENLILAHGHGWHLLSPSRGVLASMAQHCELSRTQKEVLRHHIGERISTIAGQARSADFTLVCIPDGAELRAERLNQHPVRLRSFDDPLACTPTKLITENARIDGRLLELIAEATGRELGYQMKLSLDLVHGGGDTTAACFEGALDSARGALCVVDSDKRFLGDAYGSTALKVLRCEEKKVFPSTKCFVLPVRELENAIPLSFLFEVYSTDANVRRKVSPLADYIHSCRQQHTYPCSSLDFIDLKMGLKFSDLAAIPEKDRLPFARLARSLMKDFDEDSIDKENRAIIVSGISENLLQQVLLNIDSRRTQLRMFVQKLMKSPAWAWLEELLRLILCFGAAPDRIPISSR